LWGKTMHTFGFWYNKPLFLIGVKRQTHVWSVRQDSLAIDEQKTFCALSDCGQCCELYRPKCAAPGRRQLKSGHPVCTRAVVRVFVRPGRCLSSTSVRPLPEVLHHITGVPYPCTNWWFIYISVKTFTRKNRIAAHFDTWPCFHWVFTFNTNYTAARHAYG
jgi:hypothetical protein